MLNHQRFWIYLWLFSLFGWIVVALQPVPLIDLPPRWTLLSRSPNTRTQHG